MCYRRTADTQGHTWLPGEKFIEQVVELTGFPPGVDVKVKLIEDRRHAN